MTKKARKARRLAALHEVESSSVTDTTSSDLIDAQVNTNNIDGHDYTDAKFVDHRAKARVIAHLPIVRTLYIPYLTRRGGPGHRYKGLGWPDLFAEKTVCDKLEWIIMRELRSLVPKSRMNNYCMFWLWLCSRAPPC